MTISMQPGRMVRSVLAIAVFMTAWGVSASGAFAGRQETSSCGPTAVRTVARGNNVRVYERKEGGHRASVFVCAIPNGQSRRLGPTRQKGQSAFMEGPVATAGVWAAAVEVRQSGQDTTKVFVSARNARTGSANKCLVGGADRPEQVPLVKAVGIADNGVVAWGSVMKLPPKGPEIATCSSSEVSILDRGPGVEVSTLHVRGNKVTWSKNGSTESVSSE